MALDKQRILHELGSVVNQLQSADCGCIGKIFSNPHQQSPGMAMTQSHGGCRHSCCHNHNHGSCGSATSEPYGQPQQMNQSACMARCNPPKLYADTYGYLNQNLMQPIVKEVYNDLKTITPANTTTNNALASQMGLSAQGKSGGGADAGMGYSGNAGGMGQFSSNGIQPQSMGMNHQIAGNANAYNAGNMGNHQQMGYSGNHQEMTPMAGMGPDIVKMIMGDGKPSNSGQQVKLTEPVVLDAPQSPHGMIAVTPIKTNQVNDIKPEMQGQHIPEAQMYQQYNNPAGNKMMQPHTSTQLASGKNQQSPYGQHTQGVKKFNEMFPGVMQGLGGENLGFDPMAIAIQMNPANHHKSAVNTMHNMLMGQEAMKTVNQAGSSEPHSNVNDLQSTIAANSPNSEEPNKVNQQNEAQGLAARQDQTQSQQPAQSQMQQQVYSAVGQPMILSQIDPNIVANQQQSDHTAQGNQMVSQEIKEQIMPVDTSKSQAQKYYEYNTLGQPVELLPADCYRQPMEGLPQTLSPQPVPMKSNVKNTVSKTSLMGNKPIGRTPSRSQLQNIYHQFKGSQSNTQQNVRPSQGGSYSEGRLNIKLEKIPEGSIAKVGGDTAANNSPVEKVDSVRRGDVHAASKSHGDVASLKETAPVVGKGRNGLQDVVFTSYPTSTAWSFHGNKASSPYAYRYNNMNQQRNYRRAV